MYFGRFVRLLPALVVFLIGNSSIYSAPVTYGSAVRLRSADTRYLLHMSGLKYYKSLSKNILEMDQVNGAPYAHQHNTWFIRPAVGKPLNEGIGKPVKSGDVIRLFNAHFKNKFLHASALSQGHKAPKNVGGMVVGHVGNGDGNSNWIIQGLNAKGQPVKKGTPLDSEQRVHLIHHNGSDADANTLKGKEFLKMFAKLYNPFSPQAVKKNTVLTHVREQIVALVKEPPAGWYFDAFANFNDSYMHIPGALHPHGHGTFNLNWKSPTPDTLDFRIKARGKKDITVTFASQAHAKFKSSRNDNQIDYYCIIVGGWNNTATKFRRYKKSEGKVVTLKPQLFVNDKVREEHKVSGADASINPNAMVTGGIPADGDVWEYYWFRFKKGSFSWGKSKEFGKNLVGTLTDPQPLTGLQFIALGGWDQIVEYQDITINGVALDPSAGIAAKSGNKKAVKKSKKKKRKKRKGKKRKKNRKKKRKKKKGKKGKKNKSKKKNKKKNKGKKKKNKKNRKNKKKNKKKRNKKKRNNRKKKKNSDD